MITAREGAGPGTLNAVVLIGGYPAMRRSARPDPSTAPRRPTLARTAYRGYVAVGIVVACVVVGFPIWIIIYVLWQSA